LLCRRRPPRAAICQCQLAKSASSFLTAWAHEESSARCCSVTRSKARPDSQLASVSSPTARTVWAHVGSVLTVWAHDESSARCLRADAIQSAPRPSEPCAQTVRTGRPDRQKRAPRPSEPVAQTVSSPVSTDRPATARAGARERRFAEDRSHPPSHPLPHAPCDRRRLLFAFRLPHGPRRSRLRARSLQQSVLGLFSPGLGC
jgi:hypothetical protein